MKEKKRYVLFLKDNYCRDYYSDKIIEVDYNKEILIKKAEEFNSRNSDRYAKVEGADYNFYFDSMYDVSTEIPTFENFCNYTGLDKLSLDKAKKDYNSRFKIKEKL